MGYIDQELGIKSVVSLTKWFKSELSNRQKQADVECVKVDKYIYVYWAVGNKLHKYAIKASVVYVVQKEQIDEALNEILKTL